MASLYPSADAIDTTPGRRRTRMSNSTRTTGKRKVYGKRKADAPRAVLEHLSPAKLREKAEADAIQDAVDCIQAKLADIQIDETPVPVHKRNNDDTVSETQDVYVADDTPAPNQEPRTPQPGSVRLSSSTITPVVPKRSQRMMEVRIPTKVIVQGPQIEKHESPSSPVSDRRTTRKTKHAKRLSSGYVSDEKLNSYVRPILNEAVSPATAQSIQKFDSWAARAGTVMEVVKLAEGSYGEVYKLRVREDICEKQMSKSKLARLRAFGEGVFKVVPLRAQSGPGSKKFTSIEELVAEVKMLKHLDPIPGFARFREIHVVQGRFPASFQKAWDHYKKTKDDCFNPNPSSKRAYPDSQIWAIVEMDDAGCELEKFSWSSIFQVYDIFWGVAMALARAEEYALFEHRDLHLGNVCIRSTRPDGRMDPPTDLEIIDQEYSSGFGLSTLETTLIDYSLSRAELSVDGSSATVEVTSSDLDRKQIFDAIGKDEDEALLRDTYRHMRAQVYKGNPLDTEKTPDVPGIWAEYVPRTNLIWLRFLLKTLLRKIKPEAHFSPAQKSRQALAQCSPNKAIRKPPEPGKKRETVNESKSDSNAHIPKVSQLRRTLEDRLNTVLALLDLEHGHEDMCCAADLVAFAIDSQWLDEQDFF